MKIIYQEIAYGDLRSGFVLSQERFVEEGLRVQTAGLFSELIKSLVTFRGGFVTIWDDDDPIFGKASKFGSFQTGGKDGMVNDE